MPLSHQRSSRSSSVLELFWFGTGSYFQPPFCSHRPEPDWCCRCCVMTSPFTSLIFSPTALTTTTMGDCVGSMIVLLLIIRSQIKLNNNFSNLVLFCAVVHCLLMCYSGIYRPLQCCSSTGVYFHFKPLFLPLTHSSGRCKVFTVRLSHKQLIHIPSSP